MSAAADPSEATRRVSILRGVRAQHGDQWRAAPRKHAEHLAHAAALPAGA